MNGLRAVFLRELYASVVTPVAWVFLIAFLLLAGACTFFLGDFFPRDQADLAAFFDFVPWLLLVLVPAAGMRLFAEERHQGTLELLHALPVSPLAALLGKYFAALLFLALALALTFPLWLTVNYLGHPDNGAILAAYLGSLLLGAALLALASCASLLTRSQTAAFVLALALGLLYLLPGTPQLQQALAALLPYGLLRALVALSMLTHFQAIARGVLDFGDLAFFVLTISVWLAAALLLARTQGGAVAGRRRGLRALLALLALALLYVALLHVALRLLAGRQLDLTADHLYTLAPGTVQIARAPAQPVDLTLYFSRQAARGMPQLRDYARRVRILLDEIARVSDGRVHVQQRDPQPYTRTEARALAAGLGALPVGPQGQRVIFGLVGTNATTGIETIPFLQPDKAAFLEYDVARMIHALSEHARPRVGLISGLPVEGTPASAQGPGVPAWTSFQQLGQLFDVQVLDGRTLKAVPADIHVLLLVQPSMLDAAGQAAITAFLRRGGHLAVFVDPDPQSLPPPLALLSGEASARALAPLLAQWGVRYAANRVLLDPSLAHDVPLEPGAAPTPDPLLLDLGRSELNHDDVITAGLTGINVASAGSFEQAEHAPLRMVPLLQSNGDAATVGVRRVLATSDPQQLLQDFHATGNRYVLAARLTGALAAGAPPADIVLVADTDLLRDRYWVQQVPFFDQTLSTPFANNGDFFLNIVDNLAGSGALISIRGRAVAARPFTRLRALRAEAEQRFRDHRLALQQQLDGIEQRMMEIEQARAQPDAPADLYAGAYRAALQRARAIREELRRIGSELDARVERLQWRIEALDTLAVPLLLAVLALLLAWRRRLRGGGA